jgi:type IV pilus assembly protein PilB
MASEGLNGSRRRRWRRGWAGADGGDDDLVSNLEAIEADDLHRMAEQPSLINLVNLIILEAIRSRTSDVHVEPFEKKLTVKYRVDGSLVSSPARPSICSRRSRAASRSWRG